MQKRDLIVQSDTLADMSVISEAATLLGLKTGRIHAMIEQGKLPSRFATLEETAQLLASGRIKGVPGTGIRLVPDYAIVIAVNRRKQGWPKGVARKKPFQT